MTVYNQVIIYSDIGAAINLRLSALLFMSQIIHNIFTEIYTQEIFISFMCRKYRFVSILDSKLISFCNKKMSTIKDK